MRDDGLGLTWSVRDAADDDAAATRMLRDLSGLCRDACAQHFPDEAGYSVAHRRMWGAIDGSTTEVRRGSFRALVSVQRFSRHGGPAEAGGEFRVVASARHATSVALARRSDARAVPWGIVACAAGTTGLGIAGLQLAGLLSTWGQLMALLPALLAWRMTMAMRFADDLRRDAERRALAAAPAVHPGNGEDLERWHRVLERVAAQRDAVAEAFRGHGFRHPGALPGTVAALAAPPIEPPRPARALPVPDLAMPPLGRTTAL